jgi:ABC-type uncharacterized transport system fused permease/ATPase subunit
VAAIKIKTEVFNELLNIIEVMRDLRNIYSQKAIAGLKAITAEMKEFKVSIEEVKKATTEKTSTYTAIATLNPKPTIDLKALKVREQKTADCKERAKFKVTLAATTEETKKTLGTMFYKDSVELYAPHSV